ncbi:tigger transposable element-derived protein 6 [Plakobranchus ocellatus]|uniref:Tigger transposable element-derived protein 6 n=1 Tax=Plakobranchus ocellatus TaxID=259542 RepID=A0AAV3Z8Z9_9GAST|nr:tigger transposable element-derived protein 6 [Plakobranchus ocellatus]
MIIQGERKISGEQMQMQNFIRETRSSTIWSSMEINLGVAGFQASNGWLEKFKQRHGIVFKVACGESASVDTTVVEDWKKATLDKLLSEYSSSDIFNADETGLFFRCLPNKTHAFKGEACHGGKQTKDRLTVLVGTNATGAEKLPLLVIGSSANPRCFKNVKSLPVEYTSNNEAWMTSSIFETWIRKLDRKYLLQGRSIVMVLDNCPAHPKIKDLKAIRLEFLPPNTTSHTQPCDQGIINAFKHRYRAIVVRRYLQHIDGNSASAFHISVLAALYHMRWAWSMVTPETIANCFRHAGFCRVEDEAASAPGQDCDAITEELSAFFANIDDADSGPEDYVNIDKDLPVSGDVTVDVIVDSVKEKEPSPDDDDGDEAMPAPVLPHVTGRDAKTAVETLKHYALQHKDGASLFNMLCQMEDKVSSQVLTARYQDVVVAGYTTGTDTTKLRKITKESDLDDIELGSLLLFQTNIQHYAVYVGEGEIVHLTTKAGMFPVLFATVDGIVSIEKIFPKYNGSKIFVDNSRDAEKKPHPPGIIVKRAMKKLGKVEYDLFKNNCEHFATWCRYGEGESLQVLYD